MDDALEQLPDEDLLDLVADGDEAAFTALYDRNAPVLYAVCLRITKRAPDAQAVLSDVFWEIWRKAARFDPKLGSARSYLMTLTRSRAIDRLRSESGRTKHESQASQILEQNYGHQQTRFDPAKLAESAEYHQLILRAMQELSGDQADALQLAYFEGMTHREISEQLNKPLGTVKTNIRQGLRRLRLALCALETSVKEP